MKRCPTCNRTFQEEELSFCPHDGAGLVSDTSSAPGELQATMMATPPSHGGSSYPPPPASGGPGSGSFNPPPPNPSWAPPPPNQSWATPSTPQTSSPPKNGGMNKKLIFGGIGCLGVAVIVGIVGIVLLFAFSGPSSKMNPYKGDLKELVPDYVGEYTRVDVDVLGDADKKNLGKINEGLGIAYKGLSDAEIRMLVGNYSSSKDAEDGLKAFKDEAVRNGWSSSDVGSKKIGWRTVGIRFDMTRESPKSKNDEKVLPDGAVMVPAQASSSTEKEQRHFTLWTNGSVIYLLLTEGTKWDDFEKVFDKKVK